MSSPAAPVRERLIGRPAASWLVAVVLVAAACSGGEGSNRWTPAERFAGKLEPCPEPGAEIGAWCGILEVPERRSGEGGRTIGLHVVVLPATGDSAPAPDAATFLAGGGVAPATRYAPFLSRELPRLRRDRDIVLVDQRGTGESNPLACDLPERHETRGDEGRYRELYLEALRACRLQVSGRADPDRYTTWNAADDLDAVREWLGYEQLSLWGASYGTKLAQVYMRRHPGRVRAAVLHGTVPLDRSMWPDLVEAADSTLGRLFDLCAADPQCAASFPEPAADLEDLLLRLEEDPIALRVPVRGSGRDSVDIPFDRRSLSGLVLSMLRSSRSARSIPAVIDELGRNDLDRVAGLQAPGAAPLVPRGVYLSIACAEEFPRLSAEDLERARRSSRLGRGEWLDEELAECEVWGGGTPPGGFWDPVTSDVPVLLITGAEDYITPPAYAERVATGLSGAVTHVVPQRGHDDLDPCLAGWIEDFLMHARDTEPGLGCPEDREPLAFETPAG